MCSITLMAIIKHMCLLLLMSVLDIYDVANVLHYFQVCCRCLLHHVYVFFALMVVLRSGIKLEWLIYLLVCPHNVMSGKLVNTCSLWYNNCKCCIDTYLTFNTVLYIKSLV